MPIRSNAPPRPKLWESLKRQSIQEAVIQLLCREGLANVTMERVAHEAGIAKGTVYLHYKDKQALLDSVKDFALSPLMTKLAEIFDSALAPDRKLCVFAQRYLAYFDEHRDLFRVLLYERAVTRVQGRRYQTDRYRYLVAGAKQMIEDGIRAGVVREVPPQKAAALFVESNIAMMNQRLLATERTPVEEDADLITEMFFRGFGTATRSAKRGTATPVALGAPGKLPRRAATRATTTTTTTRRRRS